jgi:hypothetical protein
MTRVLRRALVAGLAVSASLLFCAAPGAEATLLQEPDSRILPPQGFRFSVRQVEKVALQATRVGREKGKALSPDAQFQIPPSRRTWTVFYGESPHVVKVDVSDRTGRVESVRTGLSAELEIAEGKEVVSSPWFWVPLSLLFFLAFFDPRRPSACSTSICWSCSLSGSRSS